MAGDNTLLKVGLFGGALFVAYKQGWLSFLGLGTSTPATVSTQPQPAQPTGTPASTGTPAPPTATPFQTANVNSLDAVFQALNKAAPGASMNADDWNWYLMKVVPGFTAPDPAPLFSAAGFDPPWTRDMQMPLGAYWIVMSQYLKSKQGLSGMGMYGTALTGLANIARQYRRAS